MDRVLIAYAGWAGEVALVVGEQLCRAGLSVDVRSCARAGAPEGYQAVVVGSSLREGHWATDAAGYLLRHAVALAERPLWLFACTDLSTVDGSEGPWPSLDGSSELARFGPGDFGRAREWGFDLGCRFRPLVVSVQG